MEKTTTARRVDRASRLIGASPQAIYDAFLNPQALASWLPPSGASADIELFEPLVGGAFRITLTFSGANAAPGKSADNTDVVSARFVELLPAQRVAWSVEFLSDDPSFTGTMIMTWSFAPSGTGTMVTVEAEDVPPGIRAEDHKVGMNSTLANLARFVGKAER